MQLPPPRGVLAVFLVVAVVHVAAVGVDADTVAVVTKPFLVGLLLLWAWLACAHRPPRLLVAGLVAALAGDVLIDVSFLVGMGAFLVMQLCYIAGFLHLGAGVRLRARPLVPLLWGVVWVALNVVLGPSLGDLRWPIAVYSLALVTMAATAVGTGDVVIGVGGVLFLVSDLLIGLRESGTSVPASGVLVMTTYALAQLFIVTGWVARARATGRTGTGATSPASR